MATSPTQRSLAHLRDQGYLVAVVEHWNPHARIRQDLFGVIDLLALKGDETLAVQTTTSGNAAARVRKLAEAEHLPALRAAGWTIHVHGWKQDRRTRRWTLRTIDCS